MKKPNFKTEDKGLQSALDNANRLMVGSAFDYVGETHTVTRFTRSSIITDKGKFTALEFEGYMQYGFITLK